MQYGLIGETLEHSFSKEIHEHLADYEYELCPLNSEEFTAFMEKKDFRAINVTIPYKEAVIPYLDELDDRAKAIGAVNTIVNRDGKLYGYNTDFDGFAYLLARHNIDLKDKSVLILGAGGTSKTITAVAEFLGAKEIIRSDRTAREGVISYEEAQEQTQAEVIINATPNGMYPNNDDEPLVDISRYPNLTAVVDVVYNPIKTSLILGAEIMKLPCCGGLEMLVAQAKCAAELFTGQHIDNSEIQKIYIGLLLKKRNVALIGMPGSGKTTIGRMLAERLNMKAVDCDDAIEARAGKTIKEIFEDHGENAFRIMEAEVIEDLGKEGGQVISTGGGAILKEENVRALRQNSVVIFLDRPTEKLPITDGRPLAPDVEALFRLYANRYRKYLAVADIKVKNGGTAEEAVNAILNLL